MPRDTSTLQVSASQGSFVVRDVEQAHSIILYTTQYSNLTLYIRGEGRAGEAGCCFRVSRWSERTRDVVYSAWEYMFYIYYSRCAHRPCLVVFGN
jgi:hypothetical protein